MNDFEIEKQAEQLQELLVRDNLVDLEVYLKIYNRLDQGRTEHAKKLVERQIHSRLMVAETQMEKFPRFREHIVTNENYREAKTELGGVGGEQNQSDPENRENNDQATAKEILNKVYRKYATVKAYADEITVTTEYLDEQEGNNVGKKLVKTAYIRPDRFRLECTYMDEIHIVYQNGGQIRSWDSGERASTPEESLQSALAGKAGVSGGTSTMIPGLLMPDKLSGDRNLLIDHKRIADAKIGNRGCFRIRGKEYEEAQFPTTIWIDKESMLIKRIESESELLSHTRTLMSLKPTIKIEQVERQMSARLKSTLSAPVKSGGKKK